MFEWADGNITGIKFLYVSSDDVQAYAEKYNLSERFASSKTIAGTRSHHSFIPTDVGNIEMRRLSSDQHCDVVIINSVHAGVNNQIVANECQPGCYIACTYDNEWYIGMVTERSDEENDVFVKFMKRARTSNTLSWQQNTYNECWIPFQDVLCIVSAPQLQGHGGRHYKLTNEDFEIIQAKLPEFIK